MCLSVLCTQCLHMLELYFVNKNKVYQVGLHPALAEYVSLSKINVYGPPSTVFFQCCEQCHTGCASLLLKILLGLSRDHPFHCAVDKSDVLYG